MKARLASRLGLAGGAAARGCIHALPTVDEQAELQEPRGAAAGVLPVAGSRLLGRCPHFCARCRAAWLRRAALALRRAENASDVGDAHDGGDQQARLRAGTTCLRAPRSLTQPLRATRTILWCCTAAPRRC